MFQVVEQLPSKFKALSSNYHQRKKTENSYVFVVKTHEPDNWFEAFFVYSLYS
jgi:hypothetical protein